jgi:hypothetical protein
MAYTSSSSQAISIPFPFPTEGPDYAIEQKLHAELSNYLSNQTGLSAKAQADKLTEYVIAEAAQGDDYTRGHLYSLWTIILNAVGTIPSAHPAQDQLVDLVLSFPSIDTGITLEHGMKQWSLWKDMPLFEESTNEIFRSMLSIFLT